MNVQCTYGCMYTVVHLQQHDTAPFTNNNANKTQHYFFSPVPSLSLWAPAKIIKHTDTRTHTMPGRSSGWVSCVKKDQDHDRGSMSEQKPID